MTVTNPDSGRFGAGKVDDVLEQHKADLFLKKGFALAIVDALQKMFLHPEACGFR